VIKYESAKPPAPNSYTWEKNDVKNSRPGAAYKLTDTHVNFTEEAKFEAELTSQTFIKYDKNYN